MAYIKFTVSSSTGGWIGLIDVGGGEAGLSNAVSITALDGTTNIRAFNSYPGDSAAVSTTPLFTFGSLRNYSGTGAGGPNYFTVSQSNVLSNAQYPTTGYSLDIWSDALTTAIAGVPANGIPPATWFSLTNFQVSSQANGVFALSDTKTSLIYDYSRRYAPYWVKEGTITFSLTNLS
jgi:hypothetical protein